MPLSRQAAALFAELQPFGLPVVCAGGIGDAPDFAAALRMGYAGAQLGTRFIATPECRAGSAYKQAILDADESDVVWTERISGVPMAVLNTPYIQRTGLRAGAHRQVVRSSGDNAVKRIHAVDIQVKLATLRTADQRHGYG